MYSVIKQNGVLRDELKFNDVEKASLTYERFKKRGYSCMLVDDKNNKIVYVNWSKGVKNYLNNCRNDAN